MITLQIISFCYPQVASSTLRSLHLILYEDKSILSNKLVDIVDIIRTFVFYNINSTTYKYAKEDGYVTTVNSMQLLPHQQRMSHLRQQEQTKRLSANFSPLSNISINRDYGAISSDSEISDSEAINPGSRRHRDNAKIRINALLCLQAIAKVRILLTNDLAKLIHYTNTFDRLRLNHSTNTGRTLYPTTLIHLYIITK
jgi:hypothetical protein